MELLRHLGADLRGIAVDGLTAAEDDVVLVEADGIHGGGEDLGGGVRIGAAELTGRNEIAFVRAHGDQLAQHTLCRRGAHGDDEDLAAGGVLDLEGGLDGVHIIGVGSGYHRD